MTFVGFLTFRCCCELILSVRIFSWCSVISIQTPPRHFDTVFLCTNVSECMVPLLQCRSGKGTGVESCLGPLPRRMYNVITVFPIWISFLRARWMSLVGMHDVCFMYCEDRFFIMTPMQGITSAVMAKQWSSFLVHCSQVQVLIQACSHNRYRDLVCSCFILLLLVVFTSGLGLLLERGLSRLWSNDFEHLPTSR